MSLNKSPAWPFNIASFVCIVVAGGWLAVAIMFLFADRATISTRSVGAGFSLLMIGVNLIHANGIMMRRMWAVVSVLCFYSVMLGFPLLATVIMVVLSLIQWDLEVLSGSLIFLTVCLPFGAFVWNMAYCRRLIKQDASKTHQGFEVILNDQGDGQTRLDS